MIAHTNAVLMVVLTLSGADVAGLPLAKDGQTSYQIVKPANPSAVDEYAANELAVYLEQITGAQFPVVATGGMTEGKPSILIGLSAPALRHLGPDPLATLKDQEHVVCSSGQDILLYGQGVHGNLHAVLEFLENSLGWRWYSVFEHPVVPRQPTVTLAPFRRQRSFSFAYRKVDIQRGMDYFYQQGINMGLDSRVRSLTRRYGPSDFWRFVSAIPDAEGGVHTLFRYVPPDSSAAEPDRFPWLEHKDYFQTNPDFFSMWETGQRVKGRQLCFGNPELRRELTKNVLKHIDAAGDSSLLDIAAQDNPGAFCYCPACKALEAKYGSPGGPLYDYLMELCTLLKAKHPRVMIKTLAYRRSQTQKPPVLPAGGRLPENLVIDFAPIEDSYFADWTHPDTAIQETYRDLQAWSKITDHLWAWLYPNPWGSGITMPVGNVERLITNVRLMHRAGVTGLFTDHCSFHARGGWSELQSYLLYKLMQDVNCDTDRIIAEFTDNFYGPAAPLMRTYLDQLEQGRKAMTDLPRGVTYRSAEYDERTFPYLTVENIHRWQTAFDRMEELAAGQPERILVNLRLVRRELDFATLWKWFDLKKAYPEYFRDYAVHANRITAVNQAKAPPPPAWEKKSINRQAHALGGDALRDFVTLIQAGGQSKPLPPQLAGIDAALVRQFVPRYSNHRSGRAVVLDTEAAFGYAVPVIMPDLPFNFGFYQNDTKTHGARRALKLEEIVPGGYGLHELGPITVTPDCIVWFSARSWETNLQLGERLFEPGADNVWTAYVSLKFDGPTYGSKPNEPLLAPADRIHYRGLAESDLVLVDRIILVKKR